jgi:hypothetical protein
MIKLVINIFIDAFVSFSIIKKKKKPTDGDGVIG